MTEDTTPDPEPDDDSLSYELGELARVLSHVEQQAVDGAVTLAVGGVRWLRDRAEGALRLADDLPGETAPANEEPHVDDRELEEAAVVAVLEDEASEGLSTLDVARRIVAALHALNGDHS